MVRVTLRTAALAAILSACSLNAAVAQTQRNSQPPAGSTVVDAPPVEDEPGQVSLDAAPAMLVPPAPAAPLQTPAAFVPPAPHEAAAAPVQAIPQPSTQAATTGPAIDQTGFYHHPRRVPSPNYLPPTDGNVQNGYPYLNAPLYSSPRQNVPVQVGATVITNQAFYPHEYLYPHTYKAMYPPYYYDVHGCWKTTPFGVWQTENWKLRGTVVKVKYSSKYGLFSFFAPPAIP